MTRLLVHHKTSYTYSQPVRLGTHRLMLRPRENRELKVLDFDLHLSAPCDLHWSHDVFGNAVVLAMFDITCQQLDITASSRIDLGAADWPVFDIAASALNYPFFYNDDEWMDLGPLSQPQYEDLAGHLYTWALGHIQRQPTDTLWLLKDLSAAVSTTIRYLSRDTEGTQSPLQTLALAQGSCRDMAVLFIEAVRCLGFGARLVSGYLFNPYPMESDSDQAGSTHAWAEVFVPGAGWITFDPTHQRLGGANLIPVAVARSIHQTVPVQGIFIGGREAFSNMRVEVSITAVPQSARDERMEIPSTRGPADLAPVQPPVRDR